MKKINEKIKKALSFLLILTMAMTSVGVSTFSAFADSEDGTGTTELNLDTDAENTASDDTVDLAFQTDGHGKFLINGEDKTNQTITVNKGTEVTYEVTADDGYQIQKIRTSYADGTETEVESKESDLTQNVVADQSLTLSAEFAEKQEEDTPATVTTPAPVVVTTPEDDKNTAKEDDTKTEVNTIEVNRTSTDISNLNDISNNTINNNIVSTNQANNKSNSSSSKVSNKSEELLAQFSTKIYSTDSARQNNLEITSKKLNGTVVKPNETFSFTKTIGPSTAAKGYEEADIYDSNGNKIKGYGGGNCQVSSTLYNAVQKVSSLEVVERHEHSNTVPYVKEGHDAAVAYGSVDFKFKNTNNFSIKILVETSKKYVVVKLMKI
mgnify:CR=1 FL=1